MELVAKLLLAIEEMPAGDYGLHYPDGYDNKVVTDHLYIMWDAGLVDARDESSSDGRYIVVNRMTWEGHEFLDAVRKGDIWQQLGARLKDAPFDVVLDIAKSLAKKKLGLGD
jgi:hypothetical protein